MDTEQTPRILLRPAEVAAALAVSRATAYRLISSGQLAYVLIGADRRVPVEAVHSWVASRISNSPSDVKTASDSQGRGPSLGQGRKDFRP